MLLHASNTTIFSARCPAETAARTVPLVVSRQRGQSARFITILYPYRIEDAAAPEIVSLVEETLEIRHHDKTDVFALDPAAERPVHLYVIGDSTASVYPPERHPLTGWAQVLQAFFDPEAVVVKDKARSGRSSKSYREEGAWDAVLQELTEGDYVFIQFGHNDANKSDPARFTEPNSTYRDYLASYVADTRAKGAFPLILTPINRNAWDDENTLRDTMGGYPEAARDIAKERNVPLVDLHALTKALFERLGREETNKFFMNLEKGASPNYPEGKQDNTHLQEQGARAVSRLVAEALSRSEIPLKDALISTKEAVVLTEK